MTTTRAILVAIFIMVIFQVGLQVAFEGHRLAISIGMCMAFAAGILAGLLIVHFPSRNRDSDVSPQGGDASHKGTSI